MATKFRPSDIAHNTGLRSAFGSDEQEIAAMCITAYLTSLDAEWTTEFLWGGVGQWSIRNAAVTLNWQYADWFCRYGPKFLINGLNELVKRGLLTRREEGTRIYLKVTDGFVKVMQRYA